jgi:hypothetical protein
MTQHGGSTIEDGRRRLQQEQRRISDIQNIMREGFRLRREIAWYPREDAAPQRCNPGGKYIANVSYADGGSITFFAPDASGREVRVSAPPTSSAFEIIPDVFSASVGVTIDVGGLVGGASGGFIQADTREGTRQFHTSITEASGQLAAGSNLITNIIQGASDLVQTVKDGVVSVLQYLASGASASIGGIKNCPVPAEFVGHIRIYTEREGWFCEGSDMNDRYNWVFAKSWMWQHVYTVNYVDWLTGRRAWQRWLDLRRTNDSEAESHLHRRRTYQNSPHPPELRMRYFGHPWHNWADYHHYPITSLPPDVRTLSAAQRAGHYLY